MRSGVRFPECGEDVGGAETTPAAPEQESRLPFPSSELSFPATMTLGASPTPPPWQSPADRLPPRPRLRTRHPRNHAAEPRQSAAGKRDDWEENQLAT